MDHVCHGQVPRRRSGVLESLACRGLRTGEREALVGVGLVVGALVGVAAFFGALMNMSFMLAGSASTNPIMFTVAILMILAWKVGGYIGVDRYLLPIVGAPWSPGTMFQRHAPVPV